MRMRCTPPQRTLEGVTGKGSDPGRRYWAWGNWSAFTNGEDFPFAGFVRGEVPPSNILPSSHAVARSWNLVRGGGKVMTEAMALGGLENVALWLSEVKHMAVCNDE
jgi:hypothetical protein